MMKRNAIRLFLAGAVIAFFFFARTGFAQTTPTAPHKAQPPRSVRLYVFDCGILHNADMGRFNLKKEDVTTTDMSMGCFLVAHPKGNLIWDTGAIPDDSWKPTGLPVTVHVTLPDGQTREADVDKSLQAQLTEIGYSASDITYLALSHYHYDHTANANEFAGATWLVREVERDAMFADKAPGTTQPSTYSDLHHSKTLILKEDEHDVFGDGTVVIKSAPGHTPGHQILYLKLKTFGPLLVAGDLYHYPEEQTMNRFPSFEFNKEQSAKARAGIDVFLKKTKAQMWIEHDAATNAKLKKAPEFYE